MRPLSAKLLEPTIPEIEGKLDREKLLNISGRSRERQIALAAEFGITDYPSPAGGCKLTEDAYGRKLRDLMDHEGVRTSPGGPVDREMVELLKVGRRFRLPDGSGVILGRDAEENELLRRSCAGRPGHCTIEPPDEVAGPTALVPRAMSEADLEIARGIVKAWSRGTSEADRAPYKKFQLV